MYKLCNENFTYTTLCENALWTRRISLPHAHTTPKKKKNKNRRCLLRESPVCANANMFTQRNFRPVPSRAEPPPKSPKNRDADRDADRQKCLTHLFCFVCLFVSRGGVCGACACPLFRMSGTSFGMSKSSYAAECCARMACHRLFVRKNETAPTTRHTRALMDTIRCAPRSMRISKPASKQASMHTRALRRAPGQTICTYATRYISSTCFANTHERERIVHVREVHARRRRRRRRV